jgi:glycosyltransferase involved in cell wall biosynthesis
MRVGLFIDTENFGGAESLVLAIASALRSQHEPVLYHFGNRFLEDACTERNIECKRLGSHKSYKKIWRTPLFAYPFSRVLRADRIDVLHSHLSGAVFGGGLAAWLAGVPHVGTLHDVYVVQERPVRARLLEVVHRLGTTLVCVSQQMADYYAGVMNVPAAQLRVVRNGVDLGRYAAAARPRSATERPGLIMVGRLDPIKRHDLVLTALAELPRELSWKLEIVGDGPERQRLEGLAARLGLDGRVSFLGLRADIPQLLAAADVFLLVSDSEGMSLSLIEAVASGLPVVATDVGNNSELVKHSCNGYVIAPGDRESLGRSLRALLDDPSLRRSFGECSSKLASVALDFRTTLSSYLEIYEAALREK